MIATITKDFTFSAAHRLILPDVHPCGRVHGHNYVIRAQITGSIIEPGWVIDYGELKGFGAWIDENLDHQYLNEHLWRINPTAENLAGYLLDILRNVIGPRTNITEIGVGVSETPKTWATVRGDL